MRICENGGCMSKLSGNELSVLLDSAGIMMDKFEDSAVFPPCQDDMLLTTDFGFLVGDNCDDAGKISALNAISDIYAMGGKPLYANIILILGNDINETERKNLLASVMKTCVEENVKILGGHTLLGGENTILGLTVIGKKGERILKKKNCCVGDWLFLNKPLGTGSALRAWNDGLLKRSSYSEAMSIMKKTNRLNMNLEILEKVHAMTDITGYGLLGHLSEMLNKGQGAKLFIDEIPYISGILELSVGSLDREVIHKNMEYAREKHSVRWHLDTNERIILCDPQTNGPLLISADKSIAPYIEEMDLINIGVVTDDDEISICEGKNDLFGQ